MMLMMNATNVLCKWVILSFVVLLSFTVNAKIAVYPTPDISLTSKKYLVKVLQDGKVNSSFVYSDKNTFVSKMSEMTDFNHWTTFSFEGKITIEIEKLDGEIKSCKIYPLSKGIAPLISGSKATFSIDNHCKLFVEIEGEYENPLFIFASELETFVPNKSDLNVVYFEGGKTHNIGPMFRIESNKTYYIEGGAYVKGSFYGDSVSNVKIIGRGILSGIDITHKPYNRDKFDGVAIHMSNAGEKQLVEGITITNPSSYCVLSRGKIECRNVNMFGWWYETDGFGGGDSSLIDNCFMKVNDDFVKIYNANLTATNLVFYQQINGAPFQLSWGNGKGKNAIVSDINIVRSDVDEDVFDLQGNRSLICLRKTGKDKLIENLTFKNITIDQNILRIIGLNNDQHGEVKNLRIENILVNGMIKQKSYLNAPKGKIADVQLSNVSCKNKKMTLSDIRIIGNVSSVVVE